MYLCIVKKKQDIYKTFYTQNQQVMSRFVTISVTPIYNAETGRIYVMHPTSFTITVPARLSKRAMADKGRILHSLRYFVRFEGFTNHLLGKLCFYIFIKDKSNGHSYKTCFTFKSI